MGAGPVKPNREKPMPIDLQYEKEKRQNRKDAVAEFFEGRINDIILEYADLSHQDRKSATAREEAKDLILEALKNL